MVATDSSYIMLYVCCTNLLQAYLLKGGEYAYIPNCAILQEVTVSLQAWHTRTGSAIFRLWFVKSVPHKPTLSGWEVVGDLRFAKRNKQGDLMAFDTGCSYPTEILG